MPKSSLIRALKNGKRNAKNHVIQRFIEIRLPKGKNLPPRAYAVYVPIDYIRHEL
jgi:hypothetical protein